MDSNHTAGLSDRLQIELKMNRDGRCCLCKEEHEDDKHWPVYSLSRHRREKYPITRAAGDQVDSEREALQEQSPNLSAQETSFTIGVHGAAGSGGKDGYQVQVSTSISSAESCSDQSWNGVELRIVDLGR